MTLHSLHCWLTGPFHRRKGDWDDGGKMLCRTCGREVDRGPIVWLMLPFAWLLLVGAGLLVWWLTRKWPSQAGP